MSEQGITINRAQGLVPGRLLLPKSGFCNPGLQERGRFVPIGEERIFMDVIPTEKGIEILCRGLVAGSCMVSRRTCVDENREIELLP